MDDFKGPSDRENAKIGTLNLQHYRPLPTHGCVS